MSESISFKQKCQIIKEIITSFPLKCKLFINLLLSYLPNSDPTQVPPDFKKAFSFFTHTFQKLTHEQKVSFIGQLSDFVSVRLKTKMNPCPSVLQGIQTSCQMKTSFMKINYWEKRNFKFMSNVGQIKLCSQRKEDHLDLKLYLIRKSTSEKNSLVLESISKSISSKLQKITLKFDNCLIFSQIYSNVRRNIIQQTAVNLQQFLKEDANHKDQELINSKKYTILTSKTMTQYFNSKQKIENKLKEAKSKSLLILKKDNLKIYRSAESKKYYYLEQNIFGCQTLESVKQHTTIMGSQSIPQKIVVEVLESFANNITANYYKLYVGNKEYEFFMITQKIEKQNYYQISMKSVTSFFLDISVEYILVTLKRIANKQFALSISMIIDPDSKSQCKINEKVNKFMQAMAYYEHLHLRKSSSKSIPDQFKGNYSTSDIEKDFKLGGHFVNQTERLDKDDQVIISSEEKKSSEEESEGQEKQQLFYTIREEDDIEGDLQIFNSYEEKMISKKRIIVEPQTQLTSGSLEPHYLRSKPFTNPLPLTELNISKQNCISEQWQKSSKGGMVCINESVIREQNRILKLVITRIGKNIFKGNGVMNISLPIQLCRDESSLVSLSRNITYAPILLEPAVSLTPLEKMKKVVTFIVSMSPLALSTKKPFNPILGETFQADIGGCPLFMEQLSHHPPISSLLFIGRGFKIYGTIRVEASLGLNCARGSSNANLTIEFQDGDKFIYDLPMMVINGLLFGQRSIYYEGKTHVIDEKNLLVTEVIYNFHNLKKGIFNFKSESPDFYSGEIYQVSSQFMQKFKTSKKKTSPKQDDSSIILSHIEGEWNSTVCIDSKEVYNLRNSFPVQVETVPSPLPSDCTYRTDVIELSKGNMEAAQDEKDRLQQMQRKDKRLRLGQKDKK